MKPVTPDILAAWAGGTLAQRGSGQTVSDVSTDTRNILCGSLFIALKGDRFDAHDFLQQAAEAGAGALMVSNAGPWPQSVDVILVDDTLTGLQQLAAAWRRDWKGLVIGLTGSNGKTSTKDLTAAVLAQRWKINATKGNLNNHIGCPLTVLATGPEHTLAVVEMGMSHPGEIAPLAQIAAPDLAIITNVGTAHIEYMGSREAIAQEKGELAAAVAAGGCVVLNANDDYTPQIAARCKARVLTAGIDAGDVRVTDLTTGPAGCRFTLRLPDNTSAEIHLPVPGRHMAGNAALAAAAGFHLGLRAEEIAAGLASAALTKGRLQMRSAGGLTIIDDSYNANPDSMRAALETLTTFPCHGRRIAVLGRMGELGEHSEAEHEKLGALVHQHGCTLAVVINGDSPLIANGYTAAGGDPANTFLFPDHPACAAWLRTFASPADLVLLKGSRSATMEKVADNL